LTRTIEFPGRYVSNKSRNGVSANGVLGTCLVMLQEVSPEQLEEPRFQGQALQAGDIIGQNGLESTYDDYLRGRDGYRQSDVDSRGHIQKR